MVVVELTLDIAQQAVAREVVAGFHLAVARSNLLAEGTEAFLELPLFKRQGEAHLQLAMGQTEELHQCAQFRLSS